MPIARKTALKQKPKTELAYVRTTVESFGGHGERLLLNDFHSPLADYAISEKACSSVKNQTSRSRKRKSPEGSKQQKETRNTSCNEEFVIEESEAASAVTGVFNGDKFERLEDQNGKGMKMDVTRIKQCSNVLMALMNHKLGWGFKQPVDPVKLNIPDYFSIIKKPMDLGTIKDKLERKRYSSTHQFAADVRLTFSNAMNYNPPDNVFHQVAMKLNSIFNARWESLEFKWMKEHAIASQPSVKKMINDIPKQVLQRAPSCSSSSLSSKSLTSADKLKLQNSLTNFLKKDIPLKLLKFLQKVHLVEKDNERVNVNIDSLPEATLWELHQVVRSCEEATPTKVSSMHLLWAVLCYSHDSPIFVLVGFISQKINMLYSLQMS